MTAPQTGGVGTDAVLATDGILRDLENCLNCGNCGKGLPRHTVHKRALPIRALSPVGFVGYEGTAGSVGTADAAGTGHCLGKAAAVAVPHPGYMAG